jgi:hypothetical protein
MYRLLIPQKIMYRTRNIEHHIKYALYVFVLSHVLVSFGTIWKLFPYQSLVMFWTSIVYSCTLYIFICFFIFLHHPTLSVPLHFFFFCRVVGWGGGGWGEGVGGRGYCLYAWAGVSVCLVHSSQFLFLANNGMIKYSAIALLSDARRQQH